MKKKTAVFCHELRTLIWQYTSGWHTKDDEGSQTCMMETLDRWCYRGSTGTVEVSSGVAQINTDLRDVLGALPAWHEALARFAMQAKAPERARSRSFPMGLVWSLGDLAALQRFFDRYAPQPAVEGGTADRLIGIALMTQLRYDARTYPIDLNFGINSLTKCLSTLPNAIQHYRFGMAKLVLDETLAFHPEHAVVAQREFLCAVSEIVEQPALAEDWEGGETYSVTPSRRAATRSRAAKALALRRLLVQLVYQPREDWVPAVGKHCEQSYGAHLYRLRASIERLCTELYSPIAA